MALKLDAIEKVEDKTIEIFNLLPCNSILFYFLLVDPTYIFFIVILYIISYMLSISLVSFLRFSKINYASHLRLKFRKDYITKSLLLYLEVRTCLLNFFFFFFLETD